MAGETVKSAALTAVQNGRKTSGRKASGRPVVAIDTIALATGNLEANDVALFAIDIPSNAIVTRMAVYTDDLDSDGTPAIALDIGLYAAQKFTGLVSGTATTYAEDAVIDADAYVDGTTVAQAATLRYTDQDFDTATFGADDALKEAWQVAGFDKDPHTSFRIGVLVATAPDAAQAGDLSLLVEYVAD